MEIDRDRCRSKEKGREGHGGRDRDIGTGPSKTKGHENTRQDFKLSRPSPKFRFQKSVTWSLIYLPSSIISNIVWFISRASWIILAWQAQRRVKTRGLRRVLLRALKCLERQNLHGRIATFNPATRCLQHDYECMFIYICVCVMYVL